LEYDRNAGKIRYPSIEHIIAEVKSILQTKPFIRSITFHDDCFLDLDIAVLQEFSTRWQREVGLPFAILGVTPVHVDEQKLLVLARGGMNRLRMGVQSGSDRILKFYKRPNRKGMMSNALAVIARIQGGMVPPVYDIIVDNPIENDDDVQATIRLVNNMRRPFSLNVFSLRSIPNTILEKQLEELEYDCSSISDSGFWKIAPTFANTLLFLVATFRIPDSILEKLLRYAHPFHHKVSTWPRLLIFAKLLFYVKRAGHHVWYFDFSIVFGPLGWVLWKAGLLKTVRKKTNSHR
jgi:anaerobic magnesium-protoporphyrin IX monomethyl ester cyclase